MAGLYLHIPFCKQKCHYCDFHFSVSRRQMPEMIQAMKKELAFRNDELSEGVETIYFGGGTPSLLQERDFQELFEVIYKYYRVGDHPEITVEANPDDLDIAKIKLLQDLSFNRLSIGIQSFHDSELQMMNRVHTAKEAEYAVLRAQDAGFQNMTIDLIYGMPESNDSKWYYNLDKFRQLQIPHLSSYALTVESKTVLEHLIKTKKMTPVDEQMAYQQFHSMRIFMLQNGYEHYELSNYALPGYQSRHNVSYWQEKPYLGIGPSAHSFQGTSRSWNVSNNAQYIKHLEKGELALEHEQLSQTDRYNEYIMTGLRTKWGVNLFKIESDFGMDFKKYFENGVLKYLENKQLLRISSNEIIVNPEFYFSIDGIVADLFWVG